MLRFKHILNSLKTAALGFCLFLASGGHALAAGVPKTTDELGVGTHVNNFVGVLQGPFVTLAAIVLVLVAVFMMSKGEEMQQGLRTIGGVVMGFAILLAIPKILSLVQGSLIPQ